MPAEVSRMDWPTRHSGMFPTFGFLKVPGKQDNMGPHWGGAVGSPAACLARVKPPACSAGVNPPKP